MYGLLIEAVVDFARKRYGDAVWEKARKKAKIDVNSYVFISHFYIYIYNLSKKLFILVFPRINSTVKRSLLKL